MIGNIDFNAGRYGGRMPYQTHGDEYDDDSFYNLDVTSVMNAGNEFKERHIDYIIYLLQNNYKDTYFYTL